MMLATACLVAGGVARPVVAAESDDLFTARIEPILRTRCYGCHAHGNEIEGGLALDVRSGLEKGGVSGPAILPGKPEESLLVAAVRRVDPQRAMPPDAPLPQEEIDLLVEWVARGAPDPRTRTLDDAWEDVYARRLAWWSLQPVSAPTVPAVRRADWPRGDLDHFVLSELETAGLEPVAEADRAGLLRRLALVLTGLPPAPDVMAAFLSDPSPAAYETVVDTLLASPHFGERWARHWMDVVHYTDTHGYEWDAPAKNAWMYRDYLVRAFNADVPWNRLVLEQLAGDLVEPRVAADTGLNEALLGTMALRMGERRHGDNAAVEGVTQEAMANVIDTVGKAFLATTVACAQCHDHKLDAISQRDYYALAGIFMSTRWGVRCADATDPNLAVIDTLRDIKRSIRSRLVDRWRADRDGLAARLAAVAIDPGSGGFPETLGAVLRRPDDQPITPAVFATERTRRIEANRANLAILADFIVDDPTAAGGWRHEGFGMRHGLVANGEPVIADEGDKALLHLLPAGRWSHVWSLRLAGAVRSPELQASPPLTFTVGYGGGHKASQCLVVDRAFHSERVGYAERPPDGRLTFTAGGYDRLVGPPDTADRRVYLELATKSLDNYFPPRTGYGGITAADETDPRSWFGVTRIHRHPAGQGPLDELGAVAAVFAPTADVPDDQPLERSVLLVRVADRIHAAVECWAAGTCTAADVAVLNEALREGWLDHATATDAALAGLVAAFRDVERTLLPDRTIGGMADWREGRDERLAERGEYTRLGTTVPRGTLRFLAVAEAGSPAADSGRLDFARGVAAEANPLTARVFVNRVWLHCFGEGLVRTADDFGHLGEPPVHAALLDHLAYRFVADGWSLKRLVRTLVTSATWRQASRPSPVAMETDPENRLWHHHPRRRVEAEVLRDTLLAVSGRLDRTLGGPPIDPHRSHEDPAKRLVSGPLDGQGRRSLYVKMTLMEPPRFLALFNQPLPRLTTGRRDRTLVPDQLLALLNDPFVRQQTRAWAERIVAEGPPGPAERVTAMVRTAYGRDPTADETVRLLAIVERSTAERSVAGAAEIDIWQDVAHALVLTQEFMHVP